MHRSDLLEGKKVIQDLYEIYNLLIRMSLRLVRT
jgi:hypothetical protein